jgi:hypothetical protein
VDINGAKALKRRLGPNRMEEAPPGSSDTVEEAPPVYRWVGVSRPTQAAPSAAAEDEPAQRRASLFRRIGLSFR